MTTEKTDQTKGPEETGETAGCCPPRFFAEMMAGCGAGITCECGTLMQEMMKGGCCRPESK